MASKKSNRPTKQQIVASQLAKLHERNEKLKQKTISLDFLKLFKK